MEAGDDGRGRTNPSPSLPLSTSSRYEQRRADAERKLRAEFGTGGASLFRVEMREDCRGYVVPYYVHRSTGRKLPSRRDVARFLEDAEEEIVEGDDDAGAGECGSERRSGGTGDDGVGEEKAAIMVMGEDNRAEHPSSSTDEVREELHRYI